MNLCIECKHNRQGCVYSHPCEDCYPAKNENGVRTKPLFKKKGEKDEDEEALTSPNKRKARNKKKNG